MIASILELEFGYSLPEFKKYLPPEDLDKLSKVTSTVRELREDPIAKSIKIEASFRLYGQSQAVSYFDSHSGGMSPGMIVSFNKLQEVDLSDLLTSTEKDKRKNKRRYKKALEDGLESIKNASTQLIEKSGVLPDWIPRDFRSENFEILLRHLYPLFESRGKELDSKCSGHYYIRKKGKSSLVFQP